ncbi:MAG TPA: class I SAM-dependent methyltransferase [Stellaceae bacterium]|nr:class I SAM-dependent methyltransferase [Stellaceae bacterium]
MTGFTLDWLRLRASADLAARNPTLARHFAAALPIARPARIVDLGAGSGAQCRALLPRIAGDQAWTLIDRDRELIAAQAGEFTLWARRQGYPVLAGGGRVAIDARPARWQIDALPLDLAADLASLAEIDADGMTAAAFFDLVSPAWLERFVAILAKQRVPLLAALTVDGKRDWQPIIAEDAIVAAAFARHQHRDKGSGPALGGDAPAALEKHLRAAGFRIARAVSDWQLDARDETLLSALIASEAGAAREASPEAIDRIDAWEAQRRRHLTARRLRLTVGHCDLLALPA